MNEKISYTILNMSECQWFKKKLFTYFTLVLSVIYIDICMYIKYVFHVSHNNVEVFFIHGRISTNIVLILVCSLFDLQGLAFLNIYMELRGENQETYYNIGRALHQLGKALSIYLDIKIKFFNIVLLKTVFKKP